MRARALVLEQRAGVAELGSVAAHLLALGFHGAALGGELHLGTAPLLLGVLNLVEVVALQPAHLFAQTGSFLRLRELPIREGESLALEGDLFLLKGAHLGEELAFGLFELLELDLQLHLADEGGDELPLRLGAPGVKRDRHAAVGSVGLGTHHPAVYGHRRRVGLELHAQVDLGALRQHVGGANEHAAPTNVLGEPKDARVLDLAFHAATHRDPRRPAFA